MSDISDLEGAIRPSLRWGSDSGVLGCSIYDAVLGQRSVEVIELGSHEAKFAFDIPRRQRGWVHP